VKSKRTTPFDVNKTPFGPNPCVAAFCVSRKDAPLQFPTREVARYAALAPQPPLVMKTPPIWPWEQGGPLCRTRAPTPLSKYKFFLSALIARWPCYATLTPQPPLVLKIPVVVLNSEMAPYASLAQPPLNLTPVWPKNLSPLLFLQRLQRTALSYVVFLVGRSLNHPAPGASARRTGLLGTVRCTVVR
jgi:hypothetical protein